MLDRHCRCHAGDERDAPRHTVDRDPNRHPLRQSDPRIDRVDVGQPLRAGRCIRHADAARHGGHVPEDGLSVSHQLCLDAIAWKTLTFIAALRHDRIVAPWLIEGAINGESFLLYVEKVLAPALEPGDIVIMDNLGSHRAKAVRAAIRAVGARLFFLPKYSPDLNPIEMFFAKLKHWLRKAARRSSEAIYNAIAAILPDVSPNECANFFAHAGYGRR